MGYKKYNDYELLYMVRENDDDTRNLLTEKYIPIMKSIAEEYYKKYSNFGYDYDDFYIEAQIGFNKAVMSFSEDRNVLFYTFVIVCIRNTLQSFCRNFNNKKSIPYYDKIDISDLQIPDEKANISSFENCIEIESIIKNTIFNCSLEYSSILELKYNGFSFSEISILLDCPISSIQFRFNTIKNRLKSKLSIYYFN